MNSTNPNTYTHYYQPQTYSFKNIIKNTQTLKHHNKFLSLNLLIFPNINNKKPKLQQLKNFINNININIIQIHNLNINPKHYTKILDPNKYKNTINLLPIIQHLQSKFPHLHYNYFNPPHQTFTNPPKPITINI